MKRTLSILTVLLLVLCVMTSCTMIETFLPSLFPGEKPCEHEYEATVTAPTCTAAGYTTYTCKLCSDTYTADETAMLEHDYRDGVCSCGATDPNYVPPCEHEWVGPTCTADGYCSKCNAKGDDALGHSFTDGTCTACGTADPDYVPPCEHEWVDPTCTADGYCSKCEAKGDDALGHSFDGTNCSVCGAFNSDKYEEVGYSLNVSDLATGVLSADEINSVFTIVSGSEIRNRSKTFEGVSYSKSVKIGNSATKIKVAVPGDGKLSFLVQNGSSGVEMQFVTVTAPDGTVYDIEFAGTIESNPVVKIELDVTEGEWIISRGKNGGTQDVFALNLSAIVEKSVETGFEIVSEGQVNYLVGDILNLTGLKLNAIFANGKTEPIDASEITTDHGALDIETAGTYPILVYYKDYEPLTFYVNVYAPESIELGFDSIEKIENNSYGNGVYYNHSFRELYFVGDELDTTGLTVTVTARCGEDTRKFIVSDYTVEGFNSETPTDITLTISAKGITATVSLWVTDAVPTPDEEGVYMLLVDPMYLSFPGALSGPYHAFRTIEEALEFAAKIDQNAKKELYIAPGYYNDKLEITVPNLHIIGLGASPEEVVIEWNSLYGQLDASGFSHVTDSTATVAVRESAYNVTIENITISNYWNTQERMDAAGLEIERGLALLVQADRFIMKNSRLLGIQDTLELFTGRQYFENVFISGYTDFIFGTNNTTLFRNCTIHVIDTTKDDKGTAGYITAFKGSNKGSGDSVTYGAIFDGCKFTADAGVTPGCTAIGRTWAAYAAVAVINSELGEHISTAGYSTNKNERYVSMNGKPTDSTVQFVEYNNTGAGALTEAVAGMRFLTADEAALYTSMTVIFGTINGNVTYLDAWKPGDAPTVDDRTYYYFNGTEGDDASYTYNDNLQGVIVEWAGLTIDTTAGKLTARDGDTQFNQGAKIIFNVESGTLVTVISYPGYGYYTINGVAHNANDTFSMYFASACEVVIEATATSYIYQLIINPNEEAPVPPTLSEIKVSGVNSNYNVGDAFDLSGAVVKAYYSDFSVITVTDYTVDASAVNNQAAGSYEVVFTYGGASASLTVTFAGDEPVDFTVTFGSEGNYQNSGIDFSNIQIGDNGGNNSQIKNGYFSFDVKAGAVVTINGYPGYTSYTLGDGTVTTEEITAETYTYVAEADATITITPVSGNNYFYSFSVVYPKETVKEDFEVTFGSEGNYNDSGIDFSNIQIGDNGGNNSQIKNGSFSFELLAGGTLTINGYPGYTSYTLGDGTVTTEEITAELYTYVAEADVTITITPVSGNNYFYSFSVTYPAAPDEPAESVTYVLDATADLAAVAKGDKADGETEAAGTDGFFIIHYSANTKVDGSEKSFDDGYSATQRLNFGGKTVIGSTIKNALEFTVDGPATVTVWWVKNGDSARPVEILDGNGSVVAADPGECAKNTLCISIFEITEAGTYYLGGLTNNNYYFKVEVTTHA